MSKIVKCHVCGGSMIGDGYSEQRRCENAEIDFSLEPDVEPIYCGPEIANCPLCGADASIFRLDNDPVTFSHCGMEALTVELWNQYAAAMELAYRYAEYSGPHAEERQAHIAMKDHPDYLKLAQDRVLEVFK